MDGGFIIIYTELLTLKQFLFNFKEILFSDTEIIYELRHFVIITKNVHFTQHTSINLA